MFNDNLYFLIVYQIVNGKNDIIHLAGFDEPPTANDTFIELKELKETDNFDLDDAFVGLLDRETAMSIFGL